jgi:hypothetical protein
MTTTARAKELRRVAEGMITYAKKGFGVWDFLCNYDHLCAVAFQVIYTTEDWPAELYMSEQLWSNSLTF